LYIILSIGIAFRDFMLFRRFGTPIGECAIIYKEEKKRVKVVRLLLPIESIEKRIHEIYPNTIQGNHQNIIQLVTEIQNYFAGRKKKISMSLMDTSICYPFQLQVLKTERTIPYGKVASYSWVARQIGSHAYRAVGTALARNPFPLIIPCHRAVRSNRTLGGFQGGLDMKRRLLELEGVNFDAKGRISPNCFMK
jgi:methylated-DNA-[protein]-cysteine S-methyltransferase